ncbi:MAG TPA: aldo/keto reductase, partial [Chryseosolibacter sp.]|nr:aldo/keto reductase [Chryseosolibacter sp.]
WETEEGEYFFDTTDNQGQAVKMFKFSAAAKIRHECEQSLKRLRTDYIDLLQIHWPDSTTPIPESMGAVAKLIEEGKVRAAGVCNYSAAQVEEALNTINIVSNQVPYSMVNRAIEKEVVPQAVRRGISILPYSPLQRGLLSGKITRDFKFGAGDTRPGNRFYHPINRDRINSMLDEFRPIAEKYSATLSQIVIQWTLRQTAVTSVLVGARNERQVRENVGSLNFKLSPTELKFMTEAADNLMLIE